MYHWSLIGLSERLEFSAAITPPPIEFDKIAHLLEDIL